jgi:hypothetical protein
VSGAPGGPIPVPAGCVIVDATVVGLTMTSPVRLEPGSLVDFDLLLGARPIATMARVIACADDGKYGHTVELGFVAMAQVDRDTLADFLQAVGRDVVRVREPRR